MFLNDERYEDEHGRWVERHEIECLGTYNYTGDGFFKWCCGSCSKEDSSRAHKVGGTVWKCSSCGKQNLLVRTDIRYVETLMKNAQQSDTDAERAITRALEHLSSLRTSLIVIAEELG